MNDILKYFEKFQNKIKKKRTRYILSFIGTIIFGMGGITSMGISQYSVYITSYFHHKQVKIDMQYGNLIMPLLMLSQSLSGPFAGFIEKKIGLYLSLILSSLILEIDILLFINQTSVWFSFILIIFLGFSNGIGLPIPGRNLYFYYPKKRGLLGSLMTSCFILIGTSISVIGEKVINPEKYTLQKDEKFFPLEISKNYIKFYKYILFINPFLLLLALLLIKKYDPKYEDELVQEENINNTTSGEVNENKNQNKKILQKDENYIKNIKTAIINKRLLRLIGITILTPFVMGFSRNTFRVYGALASFNGGVMQYSQLFTGFSNLFVGPIWGYINDKYKYEIIIKILCGGCMLQAILFTLFIKSNTIYLICIFFGSVIGSGFMSASNLHILRVYGIKYSLEIGGVIGIFGGIFNILNALLSFIISKYFHTGEELQFAYRFIYLAGIIICGIGFFLTFYENDEKFEYPYSSKEEEYLTMINTDYNEKEINDKKNNKSKEIELQTNSSTSSDITEDSIKIE